MNTQDYNQITGLIKSLPEFRSLYLDLTELTKSLQAKQPIESAKKWEVAGKLAGFAHAYGYPLLTDGRSVFELLSDVCARISIIEDIE
jgi:hypothetical protein